MKKDVLFLHRNVNIRERKGKYKDVLIFIAIAKSFTFYSIRKVLQKLQAVISTAKIVWKFSDKAKAKKRHTVAVKGVDMFTKGRDHFKWIADELILPESDLNIWN